MTNYEMVKNFSIEEMALSIMCPFEMGFLNNYRCEDKRYNHQCGKCCLEWLKEETVDER